MNCCRCPSAEDVQQVLKWPLCIACRFDISEKIQEMVDRGRPRQQPARMPNGERLKQALFVIDRDGFCTCKSFAKFTGLTAAQSKDVLHRNLRHRKLLDYDRATGHFTRPKVVPAGMEDLYSQHHAPLDLKLPEGWSSHTPNGPYDP